LGGRIRESAIDAGVQAVAADFFHAGGDHLGLARHIGAGFAAAILTRIGKHGREAGA
jgi:hypothetical protein